MSDLISNGPILKFYFRIPKPWKVDYRKKIRDRNKFIRVLNIPAGFSKQQSKSVMHNPILPSNRLFLRRNLKKCMNEWNKYKLRFIALKKTRKTHLNIQVSPNELSKQISNDIRPILNHMSNTPLTRHHRQIMDNINKEFVLMTKIEVQTSLIPQLVFKTPKMSKRPSTIKKRVDEFTPSDFNTFRRSSPRLAALKNSSLTSTCYSITSVANKKRRFNRIELGSPLCASTPIVHKITRKL